MEILHERVKHLTLFVTSMRYFTNIFCPLTIFSPFCKELSR